MFSPTMTWAKRHDVVFGAAIHVRKEWELLRRARDGLTHKRPHHGDRIETIHNGGSAVFCDALAGILGCKFLQRREEGPVNDLCLLGFEIVDGRPALECVIEKSGSCSVELVMG